MNFNKLPDNAVFETENGYLFDINGFLLGCCYKLHFLTFDDELIEIARHYIKLDNKDYEN